METSRLLIYLLLGAALLALNVFGAETLLGVSRGWWAAHGAQVVISLGGAGVLALSVAIHRFFEDWRRRLAIAARVAGGPTLLLLPRADEKPVQIERVQVWARLADALPHDEHIAFEIVGNQDGVAFALHGSTEGVRAALTQFRAEWPGLHRRAAETDPVLLPQGWSLWWVELAPVSYEQAVRAATDDPLRAVLIETSGVMGRGRSVLQVIARRNFGVQRELGRKAFAARDAETQSKGVQALRRREAKEYEERAQETFLDVTLRAVGMADTPERAQGIARGLARAVSASFEGRNAVRPLRQGSDPRVVLRREPGRRACPWSAADLAQLAHLAGSDLLGLAPRLQTAPARYLPADPAMRFDPAVYRTAFLEG